MSVRQPIYPFTAIVGQERMKRALILNAVNPSIGGVLIRGERGTAKSTAARALAALLPEIEVVVDCRFGCDPHYLERLCDECRERVARGEELPVKTRRTRLIDLPVSATEDRVVGTLDIEQAIRRVSAISIRACWPPPIAASSMWTRLTCSTIMWWTCCSTRRRWGSTSSSAKGSASSIRRASSSSAR